MQLKDLYWWLILNVFYVKSSLFRIESFNLLREAAGSLIWSKREYPRDWSNPYMTLFIIFGARSMRACQSKNLLTWDARRMGDSVQSRSSGIPRSAITWPGVHRCRRIMRCIPPASSSLSRLRYSASFLPPPYLSCTVHALPNNFSYFARLLGTRSQRSTKLPAPRRVLGNHRTSSLPRERAAGPHPTIPIPAPGADITLFLGVQYRFTSQGDPIAVAWCSRWISIAQLILLLLRIFLVSKKAFYLKHILIAILNLFFIWNNKNLLENLSFRLL